MNLVIVESPAKAKTLKKFLGKTYKIESSVGHIRDLPKSKLGIDFENDYEPHYITIRGKGEILLRLKKEAKSAKKVYLATDPDREGEAISWHLQNVLGVEGSKIFRITFNQITKDAVKNAIKEARAIDMKLVDAQQARRVLDRVVGYKISPLLWKKINRKGLSAGRVQSVALRLICAREEAIELFVPEEYWSIDVDLKAKSKIFNAKLFSVTEKGKEKEKKITDKFIKTEAQAKEIVKHFKGLPFVVADIGETTKKRKPQAPFTTSTLQQEASKVFGFATHKTMSLAQQLYEGIDIEGHGSVGLVSYIRTDSTRIAPEAFEGAKSYISKNFGEKYTPATMRVYKNRSSSQDAHEAIRPSYTEISPEEAKDSLSNDLYKLYRLIWQRFVASQMPDAVYLTTTVKVAAGDYNFRANDTKLTFDGYTKVYDTEEKDTNVQKLPKMEVGQGLDLKKINENQHFTQPPPRFNDATLVKTLEELGIGRPSTYSSIITTLTARNYITKDNKVFYPTELGGIVDDIVRSNFEQIVDVDFTAKMENELDKVEEGSVFWKEILRQFYPDFEKQIQKAEDSVKEIVIEDEKTDVICEKCGRNLVIKFSRYGKFLACPGFPECRNAKPFLQEIETPCPKCNSKVYIRKSRKGRTFFTCENYEVDGESHGVCKFISWNKPVGRSCPKCQSFLVEKGTKKPVIACSGENCDYREK
ncbi:MAG: type I DNA topoisomerase [Defluviitaleaceae bacterium]|nr:type I DNA topoisomerase [Defluviitaleaceae bacterium]